MTLLQLYNLCLSRLGSRQVLTSTSGTDPVSVALGLSYPVARDSLLRVHPWPWATTIHELSEAAADVPGWAYVYLYPTETLCILRLFSDNTPDGEGEDFLVLSNSDGTGKLIATNQSPAYVKRTIAMTDPALFDGDFIDALSYKVAGDLAMPLANDMNLREHLLKIHYQILNDAKVTASRERTIKVPVSSRYRGSRR